MSSVLQKKKSLEYEPTHNAMIIEHLSFEQHQALPHEVAVTTKCFLRRICACL